MEVVIEACDSIPFGFAAGVMLTASLTSLILPGIEQGGLLPVLVGLALGALMMEVGDRRLPHEHFLKGHEGPKV